ncbi:hypothetical protein cypCar_00012923 [Cyprinus carpio]|nr:hypothetical protein cypCar_00012923 [Cyprinus carpio]
MITMCLQSAKREHLRSKQQQQQMQDAVHGLPIFHDIFRRADKNDDGKLSFEEFKAYFADGILTTDELRELFYSIDGRQTNNLDTDKLSDYFSQHLGEYLDVLSALEKLNVAVLKAMDKTKEEYQGSSVLGQFVTRFMLRETSSQLLSLQMSLQCAMEAVEAQSSTTPCYLSLILTDPSTAQEHPLLEDTDAMPMLDFKIMMPRNIDLRCNLAFEVIHGTTKLTRVEVKVPENLIIQKNNRRCGRRVQKNMCLSPTDPYSGILTTGVTVDTDEHWCSQINRLQQLIDKLECQSPKLEPLKEDTLASTYKSNILLVQRQMSVTENDLEEFQKALKTYADTTANQNDNLHYLQSDASKMFQRCIIDMLEDPEIVSTMLMPASWWIMTNN